MRGYRLPDAWTLGRLDAWTLGRCPGKMPDRRNFLLSNLLLVSDRRNSVRYFSEKLDEVRDQRRQFAFHENASRLRRGDQEGRPSFYGTLHSFPEITGRFSRALESSPSSPRLLSFAPLENPRLPSTLFPLSGTRSNRSSRLLARRDRETLAKRSRFGANFSRRTKRVFRSGNVLVARFEPENRHVSIRISVRNQRTRDTRYRTKTRDSLS